MIEPQSMQDGASAWFTKLVTSFPAEVWVACVAWVVAFPEPPATAPAACVGVAVGTRGATSPGRVAVGNLDAKSVPTPLNWLYCLTFPVMP